MASSNLNIIYNLPDKIRQTRKEKGMSQTELGLAMGSDKAAVSKLERGSKVPNLDTVRKAADAMDVSLSEWFESETGELDSFFLQAQKRAEKLSEEQRKNLEKLINAALEMAGV